MIDPCSKGGTNSGSRWQDLYACYFGPSGQASCGSQGNACHGVADAGGATFVLGHFFCGTTQESCWRGLISTMVVPDGGAADPTSTLLYGALRKQTPGPADPPFAMPGPITSTYTFTPAALAQIGKWIEQGAQNN